MLDGERGRLARAGYYGAINYVDDQLGRIFCAHGGRPGHAVNNTIMVHTSDHGEMLGDHYMFRKCWPYQGSAHVPLMMRGPGIERGIRHEYPVCLEDIMPTLLDLVGVDIPESVDGQSLVPILRGEQDTPVREYLHGEHSPCYGKDHANHYLVDHEWKYIWLPYEDQEQLFHLADDPEERRDLAHDPAHADTLAQWRQRMIEQLRDRPEGFVADDRLVPGQHYDKLLPHASAESDGPF